MFVDPYQFYSEIINGNKPVKDIFGNLSFMSPRDYDELFDEFSNNLQQNFDSCKELEVNRVCRIKYKMSPKLCSRVRLAIILLSICALGATFDDNVYSYTLDFILQKELSSSPLNLN